MLKWSCHMMAWSGCESLRKGDFYLQTLQQQVATFDELTVRLLKTWNPTPPSHFLTLPGVILTGMLNKSIFSRGSFLNLSTTDILGQITIWGGWWMGLGGWPSCALLDNYQHPWPLSVASSSPLSVVTTKMSRGIATYPWGCRRVKLLPGWNSLP